MERQSVKVIEGGKVVLPARFRRALGIEPGDTVTIELDEHELRVKTLDGWIRKAQALARDYGLADAGVVDEFLAEKRAEVVREEAEYVAWKREHHGGQPLNNK